MRNHTACLLALALLAGAHPSGAAPGIITYQGRLTSALGQPVSRRVDITFTFWNAETGGR